MEDLLHPHYPFWLIIMQASNCSIEEAKRTFEMARQDSLEADREEKEKADKT